MLKLASGLIVLLCLGAWVVSRRTARPSPTGRSTAVPSGDSPSPPSGKRESRRIVYRDAQGRELTTDDLKDASGAVRWEIPGEKAIPDEARRLHDQGRQLGSQGEHAKALEAFAQAARLAPEWPYPLYDAAFTYLLAGDTAKAEEFYARTVRLAPRGFFTALTAEDSLKRERAGEFPKGIYLAFVMLEWESDEARKLAILRRMVEKAPSFAPAWKDLSTMLDDERERLEALEKGLAAKPDSETRGFLTIDRALAWQRQGRQADAIKSLGALAVDPASPLDVVAIAKATLAQWVH